MVQQFIKVSLSDKSRQHGLKVLTSLPRPTLLNLSEIQAALLRNIYFIDENVISELLKFKSAFLSAPFASFLLIENCPVGDLPPTPVSKDNFSKNDSVSENFLVLIGLILGYPISYAAESGANLIDNIVAIPEFSDTRSNAGYKVVLDYHVDLAHLEIPYTPDYSALLALRGDCDEKARTSCISAKMIIEKLSDEEIAILRKPLFKIEVPDSFKYPGNTENYVSECRALLSGPTHAPEIAFEFNSTRAINDEAQAVLTKLESICKEQGFAEEIVLKQGMTLIIRNKSAVHARSEYNPNWDGCQRWLQRLYVVSDLWRMRERLSPEKPVFQGVI